MTDFVQGQVRVRFRFGTLWLMLEILRKLYLFTGSCRLLRRLFDYARGSTQNGKKNKPKIRAEFMTSVSYRPEVIGKISLSVSLPKFNIKLTNFTHASSRLMFLRAFNSICTVVFLEHRYKNKSCVHSEDCLRFAM